MILSRTTSKASWIKKPWKSLRLCKNASMNLFELSHLHLFLLSVLSLKMLRSVMSLSEQEMASGFSLTPFTETPKSGSNLTSSFQRDSIPSLNFTRDPMERKEILYLSPGSWEDCVYASERHSQRSCLATQSLSFFTITILYLLVTT